MMTNRQHRPQQVTRQPSISKHQIQHPNHSRVAFHDITQVPEPTSQPWNKPSSPTDALRPVRPPPPVPKDLNDRPYNSVAARPNVSRPSVLQNGNHSVAMRPSPPRPSVVVTSPNRPPFLRPEGGGVANPASKPVPLRPTGVGRKPTTETSISVEFKSPSVLRPSGLNNKGSVSGRPQISRPTLISATTSDDRPSRSGPARPAPGFSSSVSSRPQTQRPSVLPSTSNSRTQNADRPAVPKPALKPVTSSIPGMPGVALRPPVNQVSKPGRPHVPPKTNANNSAQNRPTSMVGRTKDFTAAGGASGKKPKVAPRPVSVSVEMRGTSKPMVKPRVKLPSNTTDTSSA